MEQIEKLAGEDVMVITATEFKTNLDKYLDMLPEDYDAKALREERLNKYSCSD